MDTYLLMPEENKWKEIKAASAEMAYCSICNWYFPKQRVAVLNINTNECHIFTREIDDKGNLIRINKT